MLNTKLTFLMTGGRIAALTALMGGTALAQGTETVIVPAPALEADGPASFVVDSGVPMVVQLDNEQAIAETLVGQGFTDVHILREGALMTVTATRAGEPIELVYSVANGSLVSVNGDELRPDPEASSAGGQAADAVPDTPDTEDASSDDAATDDGATDEDGGGAASGDADAGTDAGSDGDGDTGTDGAGDAAGDSDTDGADGGDTDGGDSDGGSTGEGGSDGEGGSGSDGGSDGDSNG